MSDPQQAPAPRRARPPRASFPDRDSEAKPFDSVNGQLILPEDELFCRVAYRNTDGSMSLCPSKKQFVSHSQLTRHPRVIHAGWQDRIVIRDPMIIRNEEEEVKLFILFRKGNPRHWACVTPAEVPNGPRRLAPRPFENDGTFGVQGQQLESVEPAPQFEETGIDTASEAQREWFGVDNDSLRPILRPEPPSIGGGRPGLFPGGVLLPMVRRNPGQRPQVPREDRYLQLSPLDDEVIRECQRRNAEYRRDEVEEEQDT